MPEIFAGFRQQPNGQFAFTMVPNQFLDEIVPFEKPCVTKVVCLILRRTLGWIDEYGKRRTQDQVAYSEFAREMNMSTQAVADGLKAALEKGYIVRVKPGTLKGNGNGTPEGAWYSLRWATISEKQSQPESEKQSQHESEKQSQDTLNFRDMEKKAESKEILERVEIKANSTPANKTPYSTYIGNIITEISQQFDDEAHCLPNIKHALNLWNQTHLIETAFVGLLYQVRDKTRVHASAQSISAAKPKANWLARGKAESSASNAVLTVLPSNRMPYFFRVLEDLVRNVSSEQVATLVAEPAKALPMAEKPVSKRYKQLTPSVKAAEKHNKNSGVISLRAEAQPREEGYLVTQEEVPSEISLPVLPISAADISKLGIPEAELIAEVEQKQEVTPVETTQLDMPESKPKPVEVIPAWMTGYSIEPSEAFANCQHLNALLKAAGFTSSLNALDATLANPTIKAVLGLGDSVSEEVDIILLFRNSFELRYAERNLASIEEAAKIVWERCVKFHPIIL